MLLVVVRLFGPDILLQDVREYLALLGVDATRMQTVSYGEDQPVDMHASEDAYAKNRRAGFRELN